MAWSKVLSQQSRFTRLTINTDGRKTAAMKHDGLVVQAKQRITLDHVEVRNVRTGVALRSPCHIKYLLVENFYGDALIIQSDDIYIDELIIKNGMAGIPYHVLHGDGVQFVPKIGSGVRPKLSNIHIKKLTVYSPNSSTLRAVQGILSGNCAVYNLTIDYADIQTDNLIGCSALVFRDTRIKFMKLRAVDPSGVPPMFQLRNKKPHLLTGKSRNVRIENLHADRVDIEGGGSIDISTHSLTKTKQKRLKS